MQADFRATIRSALIAAVITLLSTIHEPVGPIAYPMLSVSSETSEPISRTAIAHRLSPTRNPAISPNRSLTH